jgi:hypothetical protein
MRMSQVKGLRLGLGAEDIFSAALQMVVQR